jgi:hypothetical protein
MSFQLMAMSAIIFLGAWLAPNAQPVPRAGAPESRTAAATPLQDNGRSTPTNDADSIHATAKSQAAPHTRTRATAKITVRNSDSKPYDQTASPALVELSPPKPSQETSMANHPSVPCRSYATITPPA